jgi:hypothetical protein
MKELTQKIAVAIAGYRLTFSNELELQNLLCDIFERAGIAFQREFQLSPEDRPDFYIKPFAIEVKVGGSIINHLRQMKRYNSHDCVEGTILIGTKPFAAMIPPLLSGKPIACINVGGLRL